MHVSLFVTCLTDLFQPGVAMACVRVLEHLGCDVEFRAAQTCCGQPQFNNGYTSDAKRLALRMLDVFQGAACIVTPSGSCCSMIRERYPEMFADDPERLAQFKDLAARTYEFTEFLTQVLQVDPAQFKHPQLVKMTYHYNCHTRGLGKPINGVPYAFNMCPDVMGRIGNITFVPMEKADQCCGFGGTFATKYPEISEAIVKDKVECARKTGADVLVVNDAGCSMNIGGMCHRAGANIRVKHIAEILAECIDGQ